MNRVCNTCGVEKPLTVEYFYRNNRRWWHGRCRDCWNERERERGAVRRDAARALLPRCMVCGQPAPVILARGAFCEDHEPVVCLCAVPDPAGNGECRACFRLVLATVRGAA